jgi:hypothetical protein
MLSLLLKLGLNFGLESDLDGHMPALKVSFRAACLPLAVVFDPANDGLLTHEDGIDHVVEEFHVGAVLFRSHAVIL